MTSPPVITPGSTATDGLILPAGAGLRILGHGRIARTAPALGPADRRRIPSLYADPVSWLVLEAVDAAVADAPEAVRHTPDETAVILISTQGPRVTMTAIAEAVPGGRLSPMRFAGASAGGAVSLTCIVHRFRGPTLMLTSAGADGYHAALVLARRWLRTQAARHVVLSVHDVDAQGGHRVRSAVLGPDPGWDRHREPVT